MLFPDVYVTKFFFKYGLDKAPGSVLELGCGNGNNARLFTEYGWTVTGIDIDAGALDNARANWSDEPPNSWEFIQADLRDGLPDVDGPFDALVANGSLLYFERGYLERLLDQVRPLLRPGSPIHVKLRTVDDWRFGQGELVEPDTYRLTLTETGEEGATMAFYTADGIRTLLEERLGPLSGVQVLLERHDNVQNGILVENRDVTVWASLAAKR
jgi:SAM-dependent methyltransferase